MILTSHGKSLSIICQDKSIREALLCNKDNPPVLILQERLIFIKHEQDARTEVSCGATKERGGYQMNQSFTGKE